jgi:phage replication O-like protein O
MPKGDREILKADPDDGTTPIANLLLEALVVANLTSKERASVLFLIRRTYGWHVNGNRLKADVIPLRTWAKALQVKDTTRASRILSGLEKKRVIKRESLGPGKSYLYTINTIIADWDNCTNFQLLSEMTILALPKMTRVALSIRAIPVNTELALRKEKLNISQTNNGYPCSYKNKRRINNDPDKYIKGKYGHMVRR